jgi:hypothetical protein
MRAVMTVRKEGMETRYLVSYTRHPSGGIRLTATKNRTPSRQAGKQARLLDFFSWALYAPLVSFVPADRDTQLSNITQSIVFMDTKKQFRF